MSRQTLEEQGYEKPVAIGVETQGINSGRNKNKTVE